MSLGMNILTIHAALAAASAFSLVSVGLADAAAAETAASPENAAAGTEGRLQRVRLEKPKPAQGYYLSLGAYSVGAMAFDEQRDTRAPTLGPGFSLGYGQALTPWLELGLGIGYVQTVGEPVDTLSLFRMGLDSRWHFTERWFANAGFGVSAGQGEDPEDAGVTRDRYGDVYHLGLGRNLYLSSANQSGGWVLSPVLNAEIGPERPITTAAVWLGLEVSWWTGLPKRQLDLPLDEAYE